MKKYLLLSLLLTGLISTAFGQRPAVKGVLQDVDTRQPLAGATVKAVLSKDSTISSSSVTDSKGVFNLSLADTGMYHLSVSSVGYENYKREIDWKSQAIDLGIVVINKEAKELSGVVVVGKQAPVQMKGDTLQMNADQFKVNPDATSEDLLKKAPGITIENGVVKAGGEQVRKVTVDGRDFFGDDAAATLRNLPAEVVDKIQVFDRMSDQAQFTGVDDGNTSKSINIVTKPDKRNGQFGRIFAGFGTDNHYLAGGNMSFFKNNRRISIVGLANDVNQQNFTEQDLLGVTSSSNRGGFRGGGGGRGGFGGFGGGGGFLVGQNPGVSKTSSFGINYNDTWGKKIDVSGSYFYNARNIANEERTFRQNLGGDSTSYYDELARSASTNYNHRASLRIDYKIDSSNSILFTPSINFQRYDASSDLTGMTYYNIANPTNSLENATRSNRDALNLNSNLLYRHSFAKRGRTLSVNFNTGVNNTDGGTYTDAFNTQMKGGASYIDTTQQFNDQLTKGLQLSGNVNYTEPIGKKGAIVQFGYNHSYTLNKSDQSVYALEDDKYSDFDPTQSNVFKSTYVTDRGGVSYRKGDRNKMIAFGVDYQAATLNSDQTFPYAATVKRSFTNFLPNAMLRLALSKQSNIRLFYRASTNPPSVRQLQDVIDKSNPLFLSTGNPDLKQQYGHRLGLRYQHTNTQKGSSLFVNVFGSTTSDYVASAVYQASSDSTLTPTVTLPAGGQLTKPINLDGQWNLNTFVTYGMPLNFMKTNMNVNAGFVYNRTPGMINKVSNVSNSYTYNTGVVLASNISQYVDFTINYNLGINNVKNSIQPELNNKYISQAAGLRINLLSKNGWLFNSDVTNQTYTGLTDGYNQNFWLWNMAVGKKLLKSQRGEVRLSVFDLLNQNQSITRTATETYIEDVTTQVLKQYFMLTFTYNLKNFGTAAPARGPFNNRGGEFRRF